MQRTALAILALCLVSIAPSPSPAVAGGGDVFCHDYDCPATMECGEVAAGGFCGALVDMMGDAGFAGFASSGLADACEDEAPHCSLCGHVEAYCLIHGGDADECAVVRADCNCLAIAAGAP